jgi:hypothetical protein
MTADARASIRVPMLLHDLISPLRGSLGAAIFSSELSLRVMKNSLPHWLTAGLLLGFQPIVHGSQQACNSFQIPASGFTGVDAVAWSSTFFEAGAQVDISNLFSSINTSTLPAFCRKYHGLNICPSN